MALVTVLAWAAQAFFSPSAHAAPGPAPVADSSAAGAQAERFPSGRGPNVVLLLLEGVPSGDASPEKMGALWSRVVTPGVIIRGGSDAAVGSRLLPLQALFAGTASFCGGGVCSRAPRETFVEAASRRLRLLRGEAAAFGSWEGLERAIARTRGSVLLEAGEDPRERDQPRWRDSRWDRHTFGSALKFLTERFPRLLVISLHDAAGWEARADSAARQRSLADYDRWIGELSTTLEGLGSYGDQTTLMVASWTGSPWLAVRGPGTKPGPAADGHAILGIRPTVDLLLGLCPEKARSKVIGTTLASGSEPKALEAALQSLPQPLAACGSISGIPAEAIPEGGKLGPETTGWTVSGTPPARTLPQSPLFAPGIAPSAGDPPSLRNLRIQRFRWPMP